MQSEDVQAGTARWNPTEGQTRNQLLVEMEGAIRARNHRDRCDQPAEILDRALLRPGLRPPGVVRSAGGTGRHAILRVHARKVKLAATSIRIRGRRTLEWWAPIRERAQRSPWLLRGARKRIRNASCTQQRSRGRRSRAEKSSPKTKERRHRRLHEDGHAIVAELAASADRCTKFDRSRGLAAWAIAADAEDRKLLGRRADGACCSPGGVR